MGYMSGGNFSMNNHTLSIHDCDSNNGDVSVAIKKIISTTNITLFNIPMNFLEYT